MVMVIGGVVDVGVMGDSDSDSERRRWWREIAAKIHNLAI